MHTDTIFYQIFLIFHTLLFELLGQPTENAEGYNFTSVDSRFAQLQLITAKPLDTTYHTHSRKFPLKSPSI